MKSRTRLRSEEKMKKLKKCHAGQAKEIAKAKEAARSVVSGWRRPTTKRTGIVSLKVRERRDDCESKADFHEHLFFEIEICKWACVCVYEQSEWNNEQIKDSTRLSKKNNNKKALNKTT